MGNVNENFTRVNVVLDLETMKQIDDYANEMGLNRSSAIRFMCRQYLQSQKTIQSFTDMIDAYKAQQVQNVIDTVPPLRNPKK